MLQKGFAHIFIIFIITTLGVGYLIVKSEAIKFTEKPTSNSAFTTSTTPALSPSENNSEETINMHETNIYKNKLGFSILYPKYNKTHTSCDAWKSGKPMGTLAMKLFEEPALNNVYITNESTFELTHIATDRINETCKDVTYDLELVKKNLRIFYDWTNRETQAIRYYSEPIHIKYKTINSENDLITLAQSHPLYKNCSKFTKTPLKENPDIYGINLINDSIEDKDTTEEVAKKCITNFAYQFLYSPNNRVAVITSGRQEAFFMGTNNQYMPIIEFVDK